MSKINITGIRFGIFGDVEKYSRIVIEGDSQFSQYQAQALANPNRVFIDIPNSILKISGPININDGLVKTVRVGQFKPDVVRVVADLVRAANFGVFTLSKDGSRPYRLVLDVLRTNAAKPSPIIEVPKPAKLVVIDPGHGGNDPGAIGVHGIQEKHVTLAISLELGSMLAKQGFKVAYTRTKDVSVTLAQRVTQIDQLKPALAVSVHCNSFWLPLANGIETFYHGKKPAGKPLAEQIQGSLIKAFNWTNRGVKTGNFYVLREPRLQEIVMPEVGFLSNPTEGGAMAKKKNQIKAAQAITTGILAFK
ncbi:MAG: N-acetylmuramoyl-L-alanine amidase [Clostridia bacterium]|jgi:N-acetylmuramoyl-L-alanine amidase|nr:N-acetylmuramoyl-L-alanine amidase [Clostridia bacterium]